MKKLLLKILLIVTVIIIFLLLLSSFSCYINPVKDWRFAFLGLAYPIFLLISVFLTATWFFFKKKYALISLFLVLLTWPQLHKFVQINVGRKSIPDHANTFKLLSYNIRLFNYYDWLKDKSVPDHILNFIQNEKAAVVCLQEYIAVANSNLSVSSLKERMKDTPYSHVEFSFKMKGNRYLGIATYSSYPIINKGVINFVNSPNIIIYTDLKMGSDTIRVYNCHLQSTRIKKDDYYLIDDILFNYRNEHLGKIKNMTVQLRDAYKKRAFQVDKLSEHVRKSPYPVIIAGDFNDTPVSYTYYKTKGKLKDAFLESGRGFGNTYFAMFPSFRIDYIFHSSKLKSYGFKISRIKLSDHYPILCNFLIQEKKD